MGLSTLIGFMLLFKHGPKWAIYIGIGMVGSIALWIFAMMSLLFAGFFDALSHPWCNLQIQSEGPCNLRHFLEMLALGGVCSSLVVLAFVIQERAERLDFINKYNKYIKNP